MAIKKTNQKTTSTKTPTVKPVEKPVVQIKETTIRFVDKNVKIAPRKLRLVANVIKKMSIQKALDHLSITNSKSARVLVKAIKTVKADAINNHKMDESKLTFSSIQVNESVKYKRMDKSHSSRFNRGLIQKRHSRLTIDIKGYKSN